MRPVAKEASLSATRAIGESEPKNDLIMEAASRISSEDDLVTDPRISIRIFIPEWKYGSLLIAVNTLSSSFGENYLNGSDR